MSDNGNSYVQYCFICYLPDQRREGQLEVVEVVGEVEGLSGRHPVGVEPRDALLGHGQRRLGIVQETPGQMG